MPWGEVEKECGRETRQDGEGHWSADRNFEDVQRSRQYPEAGRRRIPWETLLSNGERIGGSFTSNEMQDSPNLLLLLSFGAQATLGLQKDTRSGECYIPDMGAYVKLYEVVGSELRAICISESFEELEGVAPGGPGEAAMSVAPVQEEDPSKWTRSFFEGKVKEFYAKYNPSMVEKVPGMLDKHAWKYEKLWQALHKKYASGGAKEVTVPSVAQPAVVDTAQETRGVAGLMWRVPQARVPVPTQEQLEEIMMTKGGRSFVYM